MKHPTREHSLPSFSSSVSIHSASRISCCRFRLITTKSIWVCLLVALILLPTQFAVADITLPKFFSDHMVLQQESLFPVWGTAEPNQALVIRFNGTETKAVAAGDGKFSVSIQTPTAGGPFNLEVEDQNQTNKVVLTDVMVGDVWKLKLLNQKSTPAFASSALRKLPQRSLLKISLLCFRGQTVRLKALKNFPQSDTFSVAS